MHVRPPELELRQRLAIASAVMLIVFFGGTFGYYFMGQHYLKLSRGWSLGDCAYMTVVSLTTVGYGEIINVGDVPYGRLFTSILIVFGMGVAVYFVSTLTTFFVEGEFLHLRFKSKMNKMISKMKDHIIVCGIGTTGWHVAVELLTTRWPIVVVEMDGEKLTRLQETMGGKVIPAIVGDATEDDVLLAAGIERAKGIIAVLPDDKDNLFVTVTARQLNPTLKIIAKAVDAKTSDKMKHAGADTVVSPTRIGGMRMVSEMIRPQVVEFLDVMLRDRDKNLRIEEVSVPVGSAFAGKSLAQTDIRKHTDLLVLAVREPSGGFTYNPGPGFQLQEKMILVVLGSTASVVRLREAAVVGSWPVLGGGEASQ
jgi:voltage-gated potassium channel